MNPVRSTEDTAPLQVFEMVCEIRVILSKILILADCQPTSAELEEAAAMSEDIRVNAAIMTHKLRSWVSARNLIKSKAQVDAKFAEEHRELAAKLRRALSVPEPVYTAYQSAVNESGECTAMDELEAQRIEVAHVHPVFAAVLEPFRPHKAV